MKRAVRWWLVNGMVAAFMAAWMLGVEPARNVVLAAVWLNIVVGILAQLCLEKIRESCRKHGRSVPQWVSVTYDVLFGVALAWQGHPVLAVAFVFNAAAQESWWDKPKSESEAAP